MTPTWQVCNPPQKKFQGTGAEREAEPCFESILPERHRGHRRKIPRLCVGGIPTKFIIGPQSNILFMAIGFDGNNEKLITELSVYIELAKG